MYILALTTSLGERNTTRLIRWSGGYTTWSTRSIPSKYIYPFSNFSSFFLVCPPTHPSFSQQYSRSIACFSYIIIIHHRHHRHHHDHPSSIALALPPPLTSSSSFIPIHQYTTTFLLAEDVTDTIKYALLFLRFDGYDLLRFIFG